MARGFESKSVQSQRQDVEAAQVAQAGQTTRKRTRPEEPEVVERRKQRESIELSRRRIVRELEETRSDRRREQLRAALAHLDGELAKVK